MFRCICFATAALMICQYAVADDIGVRGVQFLENYCASCHGDDTQADLDVRDRESLTKPRPEGAFVVAFNPERSRIWNVVKNHTPDQMPPDDQEQPSNADINDLRAWIEAGLPESESVRPQRSFVGEDSVAGIVLRDLQQLPASQRRFTRYFSLLHLWNSARSEEHLRLARAAVSKLINSLSSQPRIVAPVQVDNDGLVLRIDLRDYGWSHRHHWSTLLNDYPYGLTVRGDAAERLLEFTYCEIPYVRADWFVYAAARPALYHRLVTFPDAVGIPNHVRDLERLLGVDLKANFDNDRLWRAGFSGRQSGVSDHNRIVERHDARYGYYWPSYDSAGDTGRQNFSRFPLGPKFSGQDNIGAFDHDGGEFIFSLPNGLQGYMLAKASGERIDAGPQQIVRDPKQHSGTYDILNGISCMGCHKHGLIDFNDSIRPQFEARSGELADKVRRIYPPKSEMDRLVQRDKARFLRALQQACGEFLQVDEGDLDTLRSFSEPITLIAKEYDKNLSLSDVARELNLPLTRAAAGNAFIKATSAELATVIRVSEALRRFELAPLAVGEHMTRKQWERVFRPVARELGVGIPWYTN